ncbi:MAG: hypothetical protein WCS92_05020 [Candidatus Babeliales bacterium]
MALVKAPEHFGNYESSSQPSLLKQLWRTGKMTKICVASNVPVENTSIFLVIELIKL